MNSRTTLRRTALGAGASTLVALGLVAAVPVGAASAATPAATTVDLYAASGTMTLPGSGGSSLPFWGYCTPTPPATSCSVSKPGGPTIVADAGQTVTVNLHNTLGEATSIYFGGQPMVPDTQGAAAQNNGVPGEKTYTFTPSLPGTYLYEAGVTGNSQHQVAMGLFGALVVRPVGTDATNNPVVLDHQAYDDASTAFDEQAVLTITEVDPALNRATDPAGFDMRDFAPRWTLLNGKAFPATDPLPAVSSGQKLLLRWVNAAADYHSMGVLGAEQHVVALDGVQLQNSEPGPTSTDPAVLTDTSKHYVAETFGPGQTADALVTAPSVPDLAVSDPSVPGSVMLPVYDASLNFHNSNDVDAGGPLTFIEVPRAAGGTDDAGPVTTDVAWSGGSLTATLSDALTGGSDVTTAEFFVGTPGAPGTGHAFTVTSGTSVSVSAPASTCLDTETSCTTLGATLGGGQHIVYVHAAQGADTTEIWGAFSSVMVTGSDTNGPLTSGVVVTPDHTNGATDLALAATGDDTTTGGSPVTTFEWWIDSSTTMTSVSVTGSTAVATLDTTIPASALTGLDEGEHTVWVRSRDAGGYWGDAVESAPFVLDRTAPTIDSAVVYPNPNDGSVPVNGSTPAVRVSGVAHDDPPESADSAVSGIVKAEGYLDQDPAAIPMEASDGAFGGSSENVYLDIPLTTVKKLSDGDHTIKLRTQDAAGNWSEFTEATLTVGPRLWFSTSGNSNRNQVPGVPNGVDDADIFTYRNGTFSRYVDATASPYGLAGGANVDGFSRVDATHFYVSFAGNNNAVPGVTVSGGVDDEDVVRWNGDHWEMFFDGSAHGLGGTDLDAIDVVGSTLYFSTDDTDVPPGISDGAGGSNADVYSWDGTSFARVVDTSASPYDIPDGANVDGLVWRGGIVYLSFSGDTTLGGVGAVQDEDVVRWTPGTDPSTGSWSTYVDGTAAGLTSNSTDVDAFDIP
jgi:hypothetical protein